MYSRGCRFFLEWGFFSELCVYMGLIFSELLVRGLANGPLSVFISCVEGILIRVGSQAAKYCAGISRGFESGTSSVCGNDRVLIRV